MNGSYMRWILFSSMVLTTLAQSQSYETTVAPLPGETFAKPCHYEITLPAGRRTVRAVWVTFDRGEDIMKFYSDPDVVAFARSHDLALMMPHQCPAKNAPGGPNEMDMEPSHGIGRALLTFMTAGALPHGMCAKPVSSQWDRLFRPAGFPLAGSHLIMWQLNGWNSSNNRHTRQPRYPEAAVQRFFPFPPLA
jgi:hypothetical protein